MVIDSIYIVLEKIIIKFNTKPMGIIVIIIIILIMMFGKWLGFLLLIPYLRFKNRRMKTIIRPVEASPAEENGKENGNVSATPAMKRVLRKVRRYMDGVVRYLDIQTGLIPSHHIRNFIYRNIFGVKLAERVVIYYGAEIRSHSGLEIGEGSIIGDKAILDARNGIILGRNVNISTGVQIWTEQHAHSDPWFRCMSDESFRVEIGDRVWVGPRVTILHSVRIGEGAVIAAGAVVTKDVEPYSIVAGMPAKKIGMRNSDLRYEFDGTHLPLY